MKVVQDPKTGRWYRTWRRPTHFAAIVAMFVYFTVMLFITDWGSVVPWRHTFAVACIIVVYASLGSLFWLEWRKVAVPWEVAQFYYVVTRGEDVEDDEAN